MEFSTISEISPDSPDTWEDKVFITMDIEWSCDAVLDDTIDLVEDSGLAATWYVTHDTPALGRLRENPLFELGIHPNFNRLLDGEEEQGVSAHTVVDRLMKVVPEATSVRSHSLTSSSKLQEIFVSAGLTHELNTLVPETSGRRPPDPFYGWNGLTEVAYSNCDFVRSLTRSHLSPQSLLIPTGATVFGFHPIHLFLNTVGIEDYESTRDLHQDATRLIDHRRTERTGTRYLFADLVDAGRRASQKE